MSWLKLSFITNRKQLPLLEDALMTCGALTVSLEDAADQPLLEPGVGEMPLWDEVVLTALFDSAVLTEDVLVRLENDETLGDFSLSASEELSEQNWERVWMERFQPMCFGGRLWICPSWSDPVDSNAVNLMLDPGLAFGTGTHATTELCLRWLDNFCQKGWRILDYGCGSGVLAIASALLEAEAVLAVDNDPQAIQATRDNACLNKVEEIVEALPVEAFLSSEQALYDLVMANILAGPLIELAPLLSAQTRLGGCIILSGILEKQTKDVMNAYSRWFEFSDIEQKEGWVLLKGHRLH